MELKLIFNVLLVFLSVISLFLGFLNYEVYKQNKIKINKITYSICFLVFVQLILSFVLININT